MCALLKTTLVSDLSHLLIKDSIINIIIINFNIISIIILIITVMVHASHGRYVHTWNFSPIIRSQQAASKASSEDPCWSQKHCSLN